MSCLLLGAVALNAIFDNALLRTPPTAVGPAGGGRERCWALSRIWRSCSCRARWHLRRLADRGASARTILSAIYTPFSFILFYEVLMLIGALPQSTTQSIAKQYEIVSLIFIRSFFKEIAELRGLNELISFSPKTWPVFLNVGAGLLMFLLVTVFLHAARRRETTIDRRPSCWQLKKFISRKKAIALGLTVLLLAVAVQRVIEFLRRTASA